ncbi:Transcriptional regulatory protein, putative [Babesia ovata]|uniref:Transcriptional regulatory protein, putative n=1 Tax=Babesia ovata TaxID=189622 RepID=A0A2H6KFS7_9APIC|nr:Transcriptional regulatory protein, putative [Babesia ovata]GBE61837.1 Transcriptional regulatory protein, putative [Babesia ovata]
MHLRVILRVNVHQRRTNIDHVAGVHVKLLDYARVSARDVNCGLVTLNGANRLHLLDLLANGLVPPHQLYFGYAFADVTQHEGCQLVTAGRYVEEAPTDRARDGPNANLVK